MPTSKSLSVLAGAVTVGALLVGGQQAWATPVPALHGYCAGAGQCVDNGTNSPTSTNPPADFGFTIGGGPTTGDLTMDVLVPNDATQPIGGFSIGGTLTGTATLFSATAWTSGFLDSYLGISASPSNPIGAYLPSTQALDPGATGFFVYQVDLGTATLQSPSNPNVNPLETISPNLAIGSYIVAFLDNDGTISATANSGAIFETTGPTPPIPEPASLALLGTSLLGLGIAAHRRKRKGG